MYQLNSVACSWSGKPLARTSAPGRAREARKPLSNPPGADLQRKQQPPLDRANRRLRAVGHAELGDDVLDMDLDGADAERQLAGDLAVGLAFDDQLEHLALARCQALRLPVARARALFAQALQRLRREIAVQHCLAAQHSPDGHEQLVAR